MIKIYKINIFANSQVIFVKFLRKKSTVKTTETRYCGIIETDLSDLKTELFHNVLYASWRFQKISGETLRAKKINIPVQGKRVCWSSAFKLLGSQNISWSLLVRFKSRVFPKFLKCVQGEWITGVLYTSIDSTIDEYLSCFKSQMLSILFQWCERNWDIHPLWWGMVSFSQFAG